MQPTLINDLEHCSIDGKTCVAESRKEAGNAHEQSRGEKGSQRVHSEIPSVVCTSSREGDASRA